MAVVLAYYKHHERTVTADLETDLQLREIGIDPVLKMLTANSEVLGAKIHGVTEESPNIAFDGAITIAGALGVAGALTASTTLYTGDRLIVTGDLTVTSWALNSVAVGNSTTGGYGWISAGGPVDIVPLILNSGSSSGVVIIGRTTNTGERLQVSGSALVTGTISTGALTATSGSFSSTLGVTGLSTLGAVTIQGDAALFSSTANQVIYTNASNVLVSSGNLTFNGSTLALTGAQTISSTLGVTGKATVGDLKVSAFTTQYTVPFISNTSGDAATSTSLTFNSSTETFGTVNATMSGTLGVTGVATFTAAPVFSSVTASQFLLVDGSKALTSVAGTGSGSVVRATSPTLVTPTMSGPTFTSDTALFGSDTGQLSHRIENTDTGGRSWGVGVTGSASSFASAGKFIIYDDTGSVLCLSIDSVGLVTIPGTLVVTGVATLTAAPIFSSVTASQFLLVDGSKQLTSVAGTGSGSVVRATSPTLVTPTLGAASATSINFGQTSLSYYEESSFTITLTGISGVDPTGTAYYTRVGRSVTLYIPALQGTSDTTACTLTGIPAAIRPTTNQKVPIGGVLDNSTNYPGALFINSDGTITLEFRSALTTEVNVFTASGTKGINSQTSVSYQLV